MNAPCKALIAFAMAVTPIQGFAQTSGDAKFVKPGNPNTSGSRRISAYPNRLDFSDGNATWRLETEGTDWVIQRYIASESARLRLDENIEATIWKVAKPRSFFRSLEPDVFDTVFKDIALVNGPSESRTLVQHVSEERDYASKWIKQLSAVVLEEDNKYKFVQLSLHYGESNLFVAEIATVIEAPGPNFEPTPDLLEARQAFDENFKHWIWVRRK